MLMMLYRWPLVVLITRLLTRRYLFRYYSQHSVEELTAPSVASQPCLPYFLDHLETKYQIKVDEGTARGFLASFGLKSQIVLNPIGTLSGGQKVRLALALIVYPAPDLLVLDEVSTHLDLASDRHQDSDEGSDWWAVTL
jgi:ATP-binding cassette subfamily F protein 3